MSQVIRRSPEEMTRRSVVALVRHVLDNSRRESIPGPELAQLARLWEAVRRAPEDTGDESSAWLEFRLADCTAGHAHLAEAVTPRHSDRAVGRRSSGLDGQCNAPTLSPPRPVAPSLPSLGKKGCDEPMFDELGCGYA